ncbi:hypothetical protein KAI56_04710 [Candidatus Parcubacteria bacterium]|nr:hypothetical protein [Candidatus Parcubacteria bacterium]
MKAITKELRHYLTKNEGAKTSSKLSEEFIGSSNIEAQKIKIEREWYIFYYSFLNIAKNSCENIINKKKLPESDKFISIGIIYNIKHSLEIVVKALYRTFSNGKIDKSDYGHDIKKLIKEFKKGNNKKIKRTPNLSNEIDKLEEIMLKYYELSFLKKYLKDSFNINDIENTFFKYPENKVNIRVDYSEFLNKVNMSDIESIKIDINEISSIILKIKKLIK